MLGRVLQVVTRYTGTSTVGIEASGQTVISVDSVRDFPMDSGFVVINGEVKGYTAVDRIGVSLTLAAATTSILPAGTDVRVYPLAQQRWAFIVPAAMDTPEDAVWALIPHALAAFVPADGAREVAEMEVVEYQRDGATFIVTDIKDKQPQLTSDAIPDGLITETKIGPGSITTPLLAANAVATQNLQAGAVKAVNVDADALNGKTITGAILRTSAGYPRTEMTTSGIRQYGLNETLLTAIGTPEGNKFTGSVEATDMTIQDSLQMFGLNNMMATGSKMTLKSSITKPLTPPSLSPSVETSVGQTWSDSTWVAIGAHADSDLATWSVGARRANNTLGLMMRRGTAYYNLGNANMNPLGFTRARATTGEMRTVVMAADHSLQDLNGAYPIRYWLYDEAPMTSAGTVAPTQTAYVAHPTLFEYKEYTNEHALGRCFVSPSAGDQTIRRNMVAEVYAATSYNQFDGVYENIIKVRLLTITASGITFGAWKELVNGPDPFSQIIEPWTGISGVAFGSSARMGFPTTLLADQDVWVIHNKDGGNYVFKDSDSTHVSSLNWISAVAATATFTLGSLSATTAWGGFATIGGSPAVTHLYNDVYYTATSIGAKYTWRGHTSQAFESAASDVASLPNMTLYHRWGIRISVPALPAPIAGVGAARDSTKDVYGWKFYLSTSSPTFANNTFFISTTQPTGDPTVIQTILHKVTVPQAGANPPLASTFPLSSPAKITNDDGLLEITGDGKVKADEFLGTGIDKLWNMLMPIGTVIGSFVDEAPYRTLKLTSNPVAVSRTTYAALFAKIGITYGPGNGTTTFDLPGVSGRGLIGVGTATGANGATAKTLAQKVGEETHVLTEPELPLVAGGMDAHSSLSAWWSPTGILSGSGMSGGPYDAPEHDGNANSISQWRIQFGNNQPHNNMQPSLGAHFFIRY